MIYGQHKKEMLIHLLEERGISAKLAMKKAELIALLEESDAKLSAEKEAAEAEALRSLETEQAVSHGDMLKELLPNWVKRLFGI